MLAILLACATICPFLLKAQGNPPQEVSTRDVQPTFTLQSERNMVLVRVVVRDKKGEAVENLHQEDFQLFDNGKKQTILQFSVEKPIPSAPEPAAPESAGKTAPAVTGAAGGPHLPVYGPRRTT